MDPHNFQDRIPIIGFTGPIGSGCTFHAKLVSEFRGYKYFSLSAILHDIATDHNLSQSIKNLQDLGNNLRRQYGEDVLVISLFKKIDKEFDKKNEISGIVIDSIKNTKEIEFLKTFKSFFLFSIQASLELRFERLESSGRIENKTEFKEADNRDQEEKLNYGQQMKLCSYLSDIVINNNTDISVSTNRKKKEYFDDKISKFIDLIEKTVFEYPKQEYNPSIAETMMTIAYVESKKSQCLKRKVGAVITSSDHRIISTGYNDVPEKSDSCLKEYKKCYRDFVIDQFALKLKCCPNCGKEISFKTPCKECGIELNQYTTECPNCHENPRIDYNCEHCNEKIFNIFLPGKGTGGKLLDLCRSLHAEERAILNLTQNGVLAPEGSILYSTTFPCNLCANKIASTNIKCVVYNEPYPMREAIEILEKHDVKMIPFEGIKSTAYFKLY